MMWLVFIGVFGAMVFFIYEYVHNTEAERLLDEIEKELKAHSNQLTSTYAHYQGCYKNLTARVKDLEEKLEKLESKLAKPKKTPK